MQAAPRERLRFAGLSYRMLPEGTTRVVVEVEWKDVLHRGEGIGTGTLEGDLRASGEAAAAAAQAASGGRLSLMLIGIKAVRAFDGRVIIAAVEARTGGKPLKLLGAHALTEGDMPREAALTVLGALNRVFSWLVERDENAETAVAEGGPTAGA